MEHIIHSFMDSLKLLPFLFLMYLLVEYFEHKNNGHLQGIFTKTKGAGPLLGAALGTIPQCGFSVVAAALFAKKSITMGTLIAIFIATSDEAIPLMLTHPDKIMDLGLVIGVKFVVAACSGFLVDFVVKSKTEEKDGHHHHFHGNCESCHDGILKSTLIHVVKIFVFIFLISVVLGFVMEYVPKEMLSVNKFLQPFIAPIIGLIPNCAASVLLTELYIEGEGILTLSSLIGGLCAGAGVGLIVLFRLNKNIKENLFVVLLLYLIGALTATVLTLFGI